MVRSAIRGLRVATRDTRGPAFHGVPAVSKKGDVSKMEGIFIGGFFLGVFFTLLVMALIALRWPLKEKKAGSQSLDTNMHAHKQG